MYVNVSCRRVVSKGGAAVEADGLPLVAFGPNEAAALAKLQEGVGIWCRSLDRQGLLADALGRAGLRGEEDGRNDLTIAMQLREAEPDVNQEHAGASRQLAEP